MSAAGALHAGATCSAGPVETAGTRALRTIAAAKALKRRLAAMEAAGLGSCLVGGTQVRVAILAPRQIAEPRIARLLGGPTKALAELIATGGIVRTAILTVLAVLADLILAVLAILGHLVFAILAILSDLIFVLLPFVGAVVGVFLTLQVEIAPTLVPLVLAIVPAIVVIQFAIHVRRP